MATTYYLADMVAQLRANNYDIVTPNLWSDNVCQDAIISGASFLSRLAPHTEWSTYDLASGQLAVVLSSVPQSGGPANPGWDASKPFFGPQRIECPSGVLLPQDEAGSTRAAPASSSAQPQGYRYSGGAARTLWLRLPASSGRSEVGANKLICYGLVGDSLPDATHQWDGRVEDLSLLYLLATRALYEYLGLLQVREQGLLASAPVIDATKLSVRIDVDPLLASLETMINRELAVRGYIDQAQARLAPAGAV